MTAPVYQLYADGSHYDRVFGDNAFAAEPEVAFYRDLAAQADGTILELACGTGRVAIRLARADFAATIACVRKHLLPQGRFVIDVFVPDPKLLVETGDERFPFGQFQAPDGSGRVVVTHSSQYEPHTQIKRNTTYHAFADGREVTGTLDMRMCYPQELDVLLEHSGLRIERKYGGFDLRPFDGETGKQLVVCSP